MKYRYELRSVPIECQVRRVNATSKPNTKTTKKRSQWPRVRLLSGSGRPKPWLVDARINGQGERFFYATAIEADTKADMLRVGRKNEGDEGATMPAKLRADAVDAERRLAAVGATLADAV